VSRGRRRTGSADDPVLAAAPGTRGAARAVDAIWKLESAKVVAAVARMVRDVSLAEELAQDALVAALEQWPASGVPDNVGAWLMAVAKRRAVDHLRRSQARDRTHEQLARDLTQPPAAPDSDPDDVLRLMFISCHPVLPTPARVALTLRLLGGLTPGEIARAFLVGEPRIVQRIATAKRTLAEQSVPFELPGRAELAGRLSSVLEVVYLIFNEGYSATSGDDLIRPGLCLEALRLGRLLAELAPREPEVHGLAALMEIQASRTAARTGPAGEPVPLLEQNRGRWDQLLIRRGFTSMLRARDIGAPPGRICCRRRSRCATRRHGPRRTPTGRRSPRCTTRWPGCCRRRSCGSTGRSPSGWRAGRRRASTWSMH
jgi:RNA polymerase sigma factor (sigma-70 family)